MHSAKLFSFVSCCCITAGATAAIAVPVLDQPRSFNPWSKTAEAITGPIIISTDAIIFGNGERASLEFLDTRDADWDGQDGETTAQIFKVTSLPGALLGGNHLCGEDSVPAFLAVNQSSFFGTWSLGIAVFRGSEVPTSFNHGGLCGTYAYGIPNGPIEAASPSESEDPEAPSAELGLGRYVEPETPADPGKWILNRDSNPIDDTATVVARLVADEGRSQYGRAVTFTARCKSNKTEAYLNWNTYVGDDSSSVYEDWKYVTVRLGDKPSKEQRWGVSTDNEGTFAPDWAGTLLKEMVQEDRMVVQMTPYGANPITAIFDIRGLEGPLREISEECGWNF